MPTPQLPTSNPDASLTEIKDYLVGLTRYLNYLLSSLDTLNISRLDAKVIIAESITAGKIAASSITADRMNVTQLSAIAADLGTITAGIIYGAYIATANGTYPRIEFSSTGNLLKALASATKYINIDPGLTGEPVINLVDGTISSSISNTVLFGGALLIGSNADIFVISNGNNVNLTASSGNVSATSSAGAIADIPTAINSKANTGSSTSSVAVADGHNHGFGSSDYIQCYDSAGTPTSKKQWVPYAGSVSHNHTI